MFDSLYLRCPFCGTDVEEQTKAGPCLLDAFNFDDDLPAWIMEQFNGEETQCHKCLKKFKLVFDLEIKVKRKELIPVDNIDYIELKYKEKLEKQKKAAEKRKNEGL